MASRPAESALSRLHAGWKLPRPAAAIWAAARQRGVVDEARHRPWPLPNRPWFMGQTWKHLLFAHWRMDSVTLARKVPPQLPLDLRDGSAWIGVTPFRVEGLRLRGTLPPPVLSRFLEVNVRTYVVFEGKPGIYFLSLDAASRAAVAAARRIYRLPYFHARMSLDQEDGAFHLRSQRVSADGPEAELECRYRPTGERLGIEDGSLERWLAERYCLYTLDAKGTVQRADIHHPPWPLRPASAELMTNSMTAGYGLELSGEPLLHYSERQDVVLWAIEPRPSDEAETQSGGSRTRSRVG